MEADGILNAIFRVIYRRVKPKVVNTDKPKFVWFPKYQCDIALTDEILSAEDPSIALEAILSGKGFELEYWTKTHVCYARGKSWGDFTLELMKVRLHFPTPFKSECSLLIEVADMCLFDTGDLWSLTKELKNMIEKE